MEGGGSVTIHALLQHIALSNCCCHIVCEKCSNALNVQLTEFCVYVYNSTNETNSLIFLAEIVRGTFDILRAAKSKRCCVVTSLRRLSLRCSQSL